jgi:predicted HTH transcriptional regulator
MAVDVLQLLRSGESETVEFKQSTGEIQEIIRTAGAFANGHGGTIVIGVKPTGAVLGVSLGKDTLESLANTIQQETDPKVFPSLSTAQVEGKIVLILRVEESPIKPVLVQGRGYKRVGRSDHVLSSMEFIQRHISMEAQIVPTQIERLERWEYPLEALREAIINATCHRDYRDSGNIQVRIFDDRVEVWSPGLLPEGITVADLYRTHNSRPRNHRIARAFFLIGYIEQWGTGTLRMIELCRAGGLPDPEYAEISGAFVVTFRKAKRTRKYHEGAEQVERQKLAIEYVRQHSRITTQGYAKLLNVSIRTARRDLTTLVERGIFRRVGKGKAGYFALA